MSADDGKLGTKDKAVIAGGVIFLVGGAFALHALQESPTNGLGSEHIARRGSTLISNTTATVRTQPENAPDNIVTTTAEGVIIGIATGRHVMDGEDRYLQVTVLDAKKSSKEMYPLWVLQSEVKVASHKNLKAELKQNAHVLTVYQADYRKAGGHASFYSKNEHVADISRQVIAKHHSLMLDATKQHTAEVGPGTILGHPIGEINIKGKKFIKFSSLANGFHWYIPKESVQVENLKG